MAELVKVPFPVRYVPSRKEAMRIGVVEADVVFASKKETPVVIEWEASSWNGGVRHRRVIDVEMRAFAGGLLVRRNEMARHTPDTWERLSPPGTRKDPRVWRKVFENHWPQVVDHPFIPKTAPYGWNRPLNNVEFDDGPGKGEEYEWVAEAVRHNAGKIVVIDDEVWVPTWGPVSTVIQDGVDSVRIKHSHPQEKYYKSYFGGVDRTWSAFDVEQVAAAHRLHYDQVALSETGIKILSQDGWDMQRCITARTDKAIDRIGRGIVYSIRGRSLPTLSGDDLLAICEIREAMHERWPDLPTAPYSTEAMLRIPEGVEVPPASDIVPAISRFLASPGSLANKVQLKSWRAGVEVVDRKLAPLDGLEGLRI